MSRAFEWVDRITFATPLYIALCTDEAAFWHEIGRLSVPRADRPIEWMASERAHATTHFMRGTAGPAKQERDIAIITIKHHDDGIVLAGLLVHEAVHVWQRTCSMIGEHSPGHEFEAWSIQILSQHLMWSYQRQISKQRNHRKRR